MEDTTLKSPHDVNLTWQVDYANLAAISITPIGNIYVTVNDDSVVQLPVVSSQAHADGVHRRLVAD